MKPKRKLKKGVWITLIVIGVVFGTVLGGNAWIDTKLNKIRRTEKIDEKQANIAEEVEDKKEETKITNIALFGADNSGDDADFKRTDAIKIVSLDNKEKIMKITSIQRDTLVWLPDPVNDYSKWNHAYWWGGPDLAIRTLNMNLDLDLTEYVTFSFAAVEKVVDAIGGISINMSPAEASKVPNSYQCKQADGTYRLDGKQALAYSRIRKIDSDFQRMQRQNNVMIAVKNELKGKSYNTLMNVAEAVLPYVQTNLTNGEIKDYVMALMGYNLNDIPQYKVPEGEWNDIGVSLAYGGYAPLYKLKSYSAMIQDLHKFIYGDDNYQVSKQAKKIEEDINKKFAQ